MTDQRDTPDTEDDIDSRTMTHREALELRDAAYEAGARSRDRTINGQDEAINALMGRCVDLQQELAALRAEVDGVLRHHNAPTLPVLSEWMTNLASALAATVELERQVELLVGWLRGNAVIHSADSQPMMRLAVNTANSLEAALGRPEGSIQGTYSR